MKKIRESSIILLLLFNSNIILSQADNYPNSPFPDKITTLNFQHTSFTAQKVGESLLYNYPGFMSDFGSLTYNYKNSNNDSYYVSVGLLYIMLGANKSIIGWDSAIIYLNGCIGTGYLGNLGISLCDELNNTSRYELSASVFFHTGSGSYLDYYTPPSAYFTKGIVGNIIYSIDMLKYFTFSISTGLAYYQLRAMQDSNSDSYIYVTRSQERENDKFKNPIWLGHIVIPWGFAISLKI